MEKISHLSILENLCLECMGFSPIKSDKLTGSGSNRIYYRLIGKNAESVIGVVGTSLEENSAFIAIAKHMRAKGLPVPEVFAVSKDGYCYLQEDLGTVVLFDKLTEARNSATYNQEDRALLKKTISMLPRLQYCGAEGFDFSVCYPQPEFDERMISFDLNYFKYCFLKTTGVDFSEIDLDDDFRLLTADLLKCKTNTFMYRDFQARNVMLLDDKPYFIDFQGGRKGPIYYDLVSFVWQAKAAYPKDLREELIESYLVALREFEPDIDEFEFRSRLLLFALFRTLQVLGAYGFRGYFEKKEHFLQSIPYALSNLSELLPLFSNQYPHLVSILSTMIDMPKFKSALSSKLVVDICSFSYKKGLPVDNSGNGGGYVFDCRGMHNPGRYEQYKHLTGRDKAVIDFLEKEREVFVFLDNVYSLVDKHVECYIRRGFSHLLVSFGCTGGQHRSVYCAEHCAEHLKKKYPDIEVNLAHREIDM